MYRILILVIALIVYGSLFPWHFHARHLSAGPLWVLLHSWPARIDRFLFRDAVVNIALYLPAGAAAALAFSRHLGRRGAALASVALALMLSSALEIAQLFDAGRSTSMFDVVCNVTGAAAGVLLAGAAEGMLRPVQISGPLMLLACWLVYQLFPFMPVLSRTQLRLKVHALMAAPFSALQMFYAFAEWLAVAKLVEAVSRSRRPRLLAAVLLLVLPARLLVEGRAFGWSEAAGAGLALVVPAGAAAAALLLAAMLAVRGLSPFHIRTSAASFHWVPFVGMFESDWIFGMRTLFAKCFQYGAAVWLFQAAGWPPAFAAAGMALLLGIIEAAQAYMGAPHIAEITDPLLVLLMTIVLALFRGPGPPARRTARKR